MRKAEISRKTTETNITLSVNIDGTGVGVCKTGCGFLDHMLTLFARHGRFDINISCVGDTDVDFHHTTEDVAICLGKAFADALGDKRGITRYGSALLPMDEALILSAADVSGRGGYYPQTEITAQKVGDFDTELCDEFWSAFAREAGITLHVRQLAGKNSHHIIEAIFKSVARSLKTAFSIDAEFASEIPSTKGIL